MDGSARNEQEQAVFGPLISRTILTPPPIGTTFHNSAERLAYRRGAAQEEACIKARTAYDAKLSEYEDCRASAAPTAIIQASHHRASEPRTTKSGVDQEQTMNDTSPAHHSSFVTRPVAVRDWPRIGLWLVGGTMAYNVVEGVVALWAGQRADSIALVGFGLDSFVECMAATALLW